LTLLAQFKELVSDMGMRCDVTDDQLANAVNTI
jgi:hypothetical protein